MPKVKILDCTLRDGGYVNNWAFGCENIYKIISNLVCANIDYVECGFIKTDRYFKDKTFFNSFNQINFTDIYKNQKTMFCLMINYGEVDVDFLPNIDSKNLIIRVVFKKDKRIDAIKYCEKLMQKGYKVALNPMNTIGYTTEELFELIKLVNNLNPYIFTILDKNLSPEIKLGFHSHNNLKLSFSNAISLLEQNTERELIIDSSVLGIGRGAGNLCTEVLSQYLNDYYNGEYNLFPILELLDECINPIFKAKPWGASVHYYLSASNSCHPNYALFLLDKKEMSVDVINKILNKIPVDKKSYYDDSLIQNLYNVVVEEG